MTVKLYKKNPYTFEFEATIESTDGDWVTLDTSAFYPGGGGQARDHGQMHGMTVEDLQWEGDSLRHRVPGHRFGPGMQVWCTVDWKRRYALMQAHSAEHMFFSALKRAKPELELVKISLDEDQKQLIVRGDMDWESLLPVQEEVNRSIRANLSIIHSVMHRDDPEIDQVRVKLDRVDGDEVSVVEIGDDDRVACTGIHVMETGEIEAFMVTRLSSAGKGEVAIDFMVGCEALEKALLLAHSALRAADILGSRPEDMVNSARNAKERLESYRHSVRQYVRKEIASIPPQEMNGFTVFSAILPMAERADLTEAAEDIRSRGGVAVLISQGPGASVFLSSPDASTVDCQKVLTEALSEHGGRGGGKVHFAQGGTADPEDAKPLLDLILNLLRLI